MQSIEQAIKDFIRHCKFEKNLSEKTIKAYRTDLLQFNTFFRIHNKPENVNQVSKIELREFLESLAMLKPKSIKRKVASVKAMFNYLEFDEQIEINPMRKMRIQIKEPKTIPKVMELKEIGKILKAAYQLRNKIADKDSYSFFEAVRNIVVIELLFATGARVSEIATLGIDNVNVKSGEIMITGKGGRQRIIQICNHELLHLLRTYSKLNVGKNLQPLPSFLVNRFNKQISSQSIRLLVKKLYQLAGITRHITPHVFRHSFATLLLEKDVDIKYIQEMLGHSSIAITQIYTHVNKVKQRQLLRNKHPRRDLSFSETEPANKG